MKSINVLFCGDSPLGGAANYLYAVLKSIPAVVTHVPPSQKLTAKHLQKKYDVMILSDYSYAQITASVEKKIVEQVKKGMGFLMVGGWASFSGPFGGYRGSAIEKMLPVKCSAKDDRYNFPGGAHLTVAEQHPVLKGRTFKQSPAICGMNDVQLKKTSKVLVHARKIISVGANLALDPIEHPLLVVDQSDKKKVAAYTSDFAPHWCGGMVDWGTQTQTLPVNRNLSVQVGNHYVDFIQSLICWLAGHA